MPQSVETELRRETQRQKARIVELEQELARATAALSAGTKTVAVEPLRSGLTPEARRVGTILAHSRATVSFVQPPLSAEVPSPSPFARVLRPPGVTAVWCAETHDTDGVFEARGAVGGAVAVSGAVCACVGIVGQRPFPPLVCWGGGASVVST